MKNSVEATNTRSSGTATVVKVPAALIVFIVSLILMTILSLVGPISAYAKHPNKEVFAVLYPPYPGFDFYAYLQRMQSIRKPDFFSLPGYPWYYPAAGSLAYGFFYALCPHGEWRTGYTVLAALVLGAELFAANRLVRAMIAAGLERTSAENTIYSALLLSWPIYLSLQRGNLESILWLVLAAAVWMIVRGEWAGRALLVGTAAAVKTYPALCFALFLRRRKWKELALGFASMLLMTLAGLRYLQPDLRLAAKGVTTGVQHWTEIFAAGTSPGQMIYDHSLYEVIKVLFGVYPHGMQIYFVAAGASMLILFFARILWLPFTNQLLFVIAASVSLPPASFDYALQSLYIPWAWIAVDLVRRPEWRDRWIWALMFLFAVELAPMTFVTQDGLSVGGLAKGFGLIGILLIAVLRPMPKQWEPRREA